MSQQTPQEQLRSIMAYREGVNQRAEAQRRAWQEAVHRIERIGVHIEEQNLGLAKDVIRQLLDDLPHDFGAQEFFPLFDRMLEKVEART